MGLTENVNKAWLLSEWLPVSVAALILAGIDPNDYKGCGASEILGVGNWADLLRARPYFEALTDAASRRVINAHLQYDAEPRYFHGLDQLRDRDDMGSVTNAEGDEFIVAAVPNWDTSKIEVTSMKRWLLARGHSDNFFFSKLSSGDADYLNKNHPNYAPKLAAAIGAWQAVTSDAKFSTNGKSVKQNLQIWLTENADQFGLRKADNKVNIEAIENQIAKVANWSESGGAPKTPGG